MNAPTLTTDRLTLRAIAIDDWEPYAAMWADPRVTAFIGGIPRTPDIAWPKFGQAIAMWALFGYGNWAVTDRASGGFLGVCGLAQYKRGIAALEGPPEAGWTYVPDCWGRGIASEALGAVTRWADAAGLPETRCLIDDANIASIRVAERNDYVRFAKAPEQRGIFRRRAPSDAGRARS